MFLDAAAETTTQGGGLSSIMTLLMIPLLLIVMYFVMIRPQRKQEKEADRYANKIVYKLYGNNKGAVEFFKLLEKKEKSPEFLQYFSTHPSTRQRLNLINRNK